jgi:hypothetical protein
MKAAGHELNGLKAYYKLSTSSDSSKMSLLRFPFMALVSYRGYRLIATPKLPLSANSLIYGSSDAGKTVLKTDPKFNEIMSEAAKSLNIKEHGVGVDPKLPIGECSTYLSGPTDIEGHLGSDGRYYLLDTVPFIYSLFSEVEVIES